MKAADGQPAPFAKKQLRRCANYSFVFLISFCLWDGMQLRKPSDVSIQPKMKTKKIVVIFGISLGVLSVVLIAFLTYNAYIDRPQEPSSLINITPNRLLLRTFMPVSPCQEH